MYLIMNCEQFRRSYHKFDGAPNVIHWKDVETPEYEAYVNHLHDCRSCGDWYYAEQVQVRGLNPADFPCVHIAYHVSGVCATHQDGWECPSCTLIYIDRFDEYGIPIRDGGNTYWKLDFCPWCGTKMPESKREQWFRRIQMMGVDPADEERIPDAYRTDAWYRSR